MKNRRNSLIGVIFTFFLFLSANPILGQSRNTFEANFLSKQVICRTDDPVETRIFWNYGAVYLASQVVFPKKCLLTSSEAQEFQQRLSSESKIKAIDGLPTFRLQNAAADSFDKVIKELKTAFGSKTRAAIAEMNRVRAALKIQRNESTDVIFWIPRECNTNKVRNPAGCLDCLINNDWAVRDYDQVLGNWNGRVGKDQKITTSMTDSEVRKRIAESIRLDTNLPSSAAIPGSSQHLLLAAIDVNSEVCNPGSACEKALMKNGWYRTVLNDKDHFTYLGIARDQLAGLGLQEKPQNRYIYYIPKR